jgi:hypothetical protein
MKYLLYFGSFFVLFNSCKKEGGTTEPDRTVTADSISLLTRIQQPYESSSDFKYDSQHRLIGYGRYGTNFYDTCRILYNSEGLPAAIISYHSLIYDGFARPCVFVYQGNKLVRVVVKKEKRPGTVSNDYFLSYDRPADIIGYDSIVYNASNQISKSYFFRTNYTAPDPPVLWNYRLFTYFPGKDSLLQKVESYDKDINNNYNLAFSFTHFTYDTKPNPFYKMVPWYPLLSELGLITKFWVFSYYYTSRYGSDFMISLPNNSITSSIRSNIKYVYNADSLPIRSVIANDELEGVNYIYTKVKQ